MADFAFKPPLVGSTVSVQSQYEKSFMKHAAKTRGDIQEARRRAKDELGISKTGAALDRLLSKDKYASIDPHMRPDRKP